MNIACRSSIALLLGVALLLPGGCPTDTTPLEYVQGGRGDPTVISGETSLNVLTPASDLSITGGTQVEVNWQAFSASRFALFNVFFDPDVDPTNGNEIFAATNLELSENQRLIDTALLDRGTYFIGVSLEELNSILTFDYAPGSITIDQRPDLFFFSPRQSYVFDRTERINPQFQVRWEVADPDSTNAVEIYLTRFDVENGVEVADTSTKVLLFRSESQTGDEFTFNLPTTSFDAGLYRLVAEVSDGQNVTSFTVPGSIRLRSRLAGYYDLRDLDLPDSPVPGAIFEGFNPRDNAGSFVASAEDLDADGFDEFLIVSQFGKPRYDTNLQRQGVGEAYLIYGRSQPFSGKINLNSTGTLFRGEIYGGVEEVADPLRPSRGITSFTVLSDWDGDGVREFAFGIPFTDSVAFDFLDAAGYFRSGGVIVVAGSTLGGFGGQNFFPLGRVGTWSLPSGGFRPDNPCPRGFVGPKAPTTTGGPTYYYYNYTTAVAPAYYGCRIATAQFGDQCADSISAYPFFEGGVDQLALVISSPNRDPFRCTAISNNIAGGGAVSVYYPTVGASLWALDNDSIPHDGPWHYILDERKGFYASEPWGAIFMPPGSPPNCPRTTAAYLPTTSNTARYYGSFEGAGVGNAVGVGDFSADGIADLAIGSPLSDEGAGACFITLGRIPELIEGTELNLEELGLPTSSETTERIFDGIRLVGAPGARLGQSQDASGDFNADGVDDVLIGSPLINNRQGGAAVFFGDREVINLTQEEIPFDELAARGLGVIFVGEAEGDLAGSRVAGVGDVDGDGKDDILIAAPGRSVRLDADFDGNFEIDRTECGIVYLVYGDSDLINRRTPGGQPGVLELKYIGTEHLPGAAFIGRFSGDQLGAGFGDQGDRSLGADSAGDVNGDGFRDLLLGAVNASPRDRAQAGEAYLVYGTGD